MRLAGRRIVVTGGTGGLGRVVVRALLAAGARVAVPYRGAAGFEALSADAPPDALWGKSADLSRADSAAAFFREAGGWLGGLDGLALLAGAYAGSGRFEEAPADEWDSMLGANLEPVRHACRAALPLLLGGGGSVVTVATRLVETGGAGASAYVVSKAAVVALTRVLALENRERGVRFNCVAPGIIDTAANRVAMPNADHSRWTPPEAIARTVLFLLDREASAAVTGAVVPVDAAA